MGDVIVCDVKHTNAARVVIIHTTEEEGFSLPLSKTKWVLISSRVQYQKMKMKHECHKSKLAPTSSYNLDEHNNIICELGRLVEK